MAFGDEIVKMADTHIKENYVLGARAKFLDPNFRGPWDCAEFVSWVIFQASGEKELLGCVPRDPARADAYTGYWVDDAKKYGLIVSISEALRTPGFALLRSPVGHPHGHIAISVGDGKTTVEAYDTAHGVINGPADPSTRGWEYGVRIPTPDEWTQLTSNASKPQNWFFRPTSSPRTDPRVGVIEASLKTNGVRLGESTGRFTSALGKKVAKFQHENDLVVDGMVGPQTSQALGLDWKAKETPPGIYNDKYGVYFDALVAGGFFSHDPDDLHVRRSIRTNNPGALNFSNWQKTMKGYVGITPPDNSPNQNRTTIYRTPEHGVAAWFSLLADRYGYADTGPFSLLTLASKYAGAKASDADIRAYTDGWAKASGNKLTPASTFDIRDTDTLFVLGRAMFTHEIGGKCPLGDDQIRYGIDHQRNGSMPA
jgi:N-acetylmuramoyl-L-alanine amidase